ncbi:MAG: BTAD domain-containing putative transcriptional regulator [Cyanobacteria bacterium P01_H01_bin.105]
MSGSTDRALWGFDVWIVATTMEYDVVLTFVNHAMSTVHGRTLNEAELELFKGAWHGQTYETIAEQSGYASSYLTRVVGPKFWKTLSEAVGTRVSKSRFRAALLQLSKNWEQTQTFAPFLPPSAAKESTQSPYPNQASNQASSSQGTLSQNIATASPKTEPFSCSVDWGEAPDVTTFYGRQQELATLTQWLTIDRCRVVGIFGMGGIGKTALAAKLVETMLNTANCPFTHIIWRSLRNAPSLLEMLEELVPFLSNQQDTEATPKRLLYWLRQSACLLVLDNTETLLQGNADPTQTPHQESRAGFWRTGYEDYGHLLQLLAETRHQSSVILTSREKPAIVGTLEGVDLQVHSLHLGGSSEAAQSLLTAKGLIGSESEKQTLGDRLGNSPLALKIVATSINSLFEGNIGLFLAEDTLLFNGAKQLLDQHFERLTSLETKLMVWLAINRDWTSIADLMTDIYPPCSKSQLLETLESLSWRSLIEQQGKTYTQQPVVMEYVTEHLITQISAELIEGIVENLAFLDSYALIKTTTKDYIRESQIRLILNAIGDRLMAQFLNKKSLSHHLYTVLQAIRHHAKPLTGYGIGNIFNLCLHLKLDLTSFDFSDCTIRQVNFRTQQSVNANISRATLHDCRFTETFGGILSLACSPDNTMMAFGDMVGTLCLWHLESDLDRGQGTQPIFHQSYRTLSGHTDGIAAITWQPAGQRLATASSDATIRIWDRKTGQCLAVLIGHRGPVWTVDWSPDGKIIASGSSDRTIKLWDAATGDCLATLTGHQSLVWSVAWHPDGTYLASSSEDYSLRQWDMQTNECIRVFPLAKARVRRVVWSPDGTTLASGSADHCIRLWDGQTGKLIRCLSLPAIIEMDDAWSEDNSVQSGAVHNNPRDRERPAQTKPSLNPDDLPGTPSLNKAFWVDSLVWSPDGQFLASGGDRILYLWSPDTGTCVRTFYGHQEHIWGLNWTADSQTLVSGSHDQTVRLWNVAQGYCRQTIKGYTALVKMVAWSPDDKTLATVGTDQALRFWDVDTGQCTQVMTEHQGWSFSVSWCPNQPLVASSSSDATIKLWDVHTGQCLQTLTGHRSWVWSVAWSPDGTLLASGSSTNDLTVRVWNAATGDCLHVLHGHKSWIWMVAWHPHGDIFATAGDDRCIILWDATTGERLKTLHDDHLLAMSIAWSPDGKWIASSSSTKAIKLWNVETGTCEREFTGHPGIVWAVAWSPDGNWVASASENDYAVRFWHVETGTCAHTCLGHSQRIWSLAWSSGGRHVASSSQDGTIRIWDASTGKCIKTLRSDRPYEGMDITGVQGITEAQKQTLKVLGATDQSSQKSSINSVVTSPEKSLGEPPGTLRESLQEISSPDSKAMSDKATAREPSTHITFTASQDLSPTLLNIQLLGGFQITDHTGGILDLSNRRSQALLAYLILNNSIVHTRQHLAFLFSPNASDSQGRSALRKDLFKLRQALPAAASHLRIDAQTIQWNPDATYHLDVAEFEQALDQAVHLPAETLREQQQLIERAISFYHGYLLPSQDHDWVIQERERLHQKYLGSLGQLIQLLEQQQNYTQAIYYGQQLQQQEPLRESTYQALMRLHDKRGDRAVALQIYHQCMTRLRDELGVDPSAATQALYQTLLN